MCALVSHRVKRAYEQAGRESKQARLGIESSKSIWAVMLTYVMVLLDNNINGRRSGQWCCGGGAVVD